MGMVPPRVVLPLTAREAWNEALWENMRPRVLVPQGQHNTALLALMKTIEEEIAERQRWEAIAEEMLFAPPDWQKREVLVP